MTHPNRSRQPCRPRDIVSAVGRAYPRAWEQMDAFRALRGKGDMPAWPDWCYVPLHGAHAVVSGGGDLPFERSHHTGIVGALAAWRMTQGIYRYDPVLYECLRETLIEGDLPCDPLYRLPEWCAYIETPDMEWRIGGEVRPIYGVWAHLDWSDGSADELRLMLDTALSPDEALDPMRGCIPIPIILGTGGIAEGIERVVASGAEQARLHGMRPPADLLDARAIAPTLAPLVSLALYLCAEAPEIDGTGRPGNPEPKRTRHGWRMFPADKPRTWDVGVRIGAALRRAYISPSPPGHREEPP